MGGTTVLVMAEMAAAIAERGPNTIPGTVRLVAVGGGMVTGVTEWPTVVQVMERVDTGEHQALQGDTVPAVMMQTVGLAAAAVQLVTDSLAEAVGGIPGVEVVTIGPGRVTRAMVVVKVVDRIIMELIKVIVRVVTVPVSDTSQSPSCKNFSVRVRCQGLPN
jgi:hypothetical protein